MPANATQTYTDRVRRFGAERDRIGATWGTIANVRLAVFVASVIAVTIGAFAQNEPLVWLAAGLFAAFLGLVVYHSRLGRERRRFAELTSINEEALLKVARSWRALPDRKQPTAPSGHAYAPDLDVIGHASLWVLLDRTSTASGQSALRDMLFAPADPQVIRAHQEAVRELGPLIELRDALTLAGRLAGADLAEPERFLRWAESEVWLAHRPWLRIFAVVSVALLWVTLGLQLAGILSVPVWAGLAGLNFLFLGGFGNEIHARQSEVAGLEQSFQRYAALLQLMSEARFTAPHLRQLQSALVTAGKPAHEQMRRLRGISRLVVPRSSMFYVLHQMFTLWDVHVLGRLEGWQRDVGRQARGWLTALGEFEALACLAVLAHDHPEWSYPDVDPTVDRIEGITLGHPLLPDDVRVSNDVTLGPAGSVLLVTGSNMSGKSTLLRSIGVNLVLAGAGAPVCAARFRTPPVRLWTSMRVQDSLERGVSFFLAELERLKAVVDASREPGPPVCYLLDEILQGTNTAERHIAARRVILHLVHQGALGAVSTHDLTLADDPAVAEVAQLVHLRESVEEGPGGARMTFDYLVRPGLATSTNALRLMTLVGLDLEDVD